MVETKFEGAIFQLRERINPHPTVVDTAHASVELGFTSAERPPIDPIQKIFDETIIWTDDTTTAITATSNCINLREDRRKLSLPQVDFLQLDEGQYAMLEYSDILRLIVNTNPVDTIARNGKRIQGFTTKHILVGGKQGRSIDILSIPQKRTQNIFTFSGFSPFFSAKRVYAGADTTLMIPTYFNKDPEEFKKIKASGGREFDSQVILSMPMTKTKESFRWNSILFPLITLHENAHAALNDLNVVSHNEERTVNALALQAIRIINRSFSSDSFFDEAQVVQDIHNQLRNGYGSRKL